MFDYVLICQPRDPLSKPDGDAGAGRSLAWRMATAVAWSPMEADRTRLRFCNYLIVWTRDNASVWTKFCPISAVRLALPLSNQPPCGSMQERLANLPACLTVFSVALCFIPFLFSFFLVCTRRCINTENGCSSNLRHTYSIPLSFFSSLKLYCDAIISRLRCITPCRSSEDQAKRVPFPAPIPWHLVFRNRDKTNETGKYCKRKQKFRDTPSRLRVPR